MERREYERLLDNLASANVPVEQTKEKLMNTFDLMSKALVDDFEAGHDPKRRASWSATGFRLSNWLAWRKS